MRRGVLCTNGKRGVVVGKSDSPTMVYTDKREQGGQSTYRDKGSWQHDREYIHFCNPAIEMRIISIYFTIYIGFFQLLIPYSPVKL